jgi:hypothetical protein
MNMKKKNTLLFLCQVETECQTMQFSSNPIFHEKTNNIKVECENFSFVISNDQLANIFTMQGL